jgi:hypothetical protein
VFRSELPLKKWLQKALLILCGLLLPLTIVEFAMRAYARLASQERTITADYLLGWKLIPHTKHLFRKEEQPYLIVINSKGLRDREHSYEKSKGLFRIVVVGDCLSLDPVAWRPRTGLRTFWKNPQETLK